MKDTESRAREWVCCFCSKTYRRSDVLRRHYINCPSRGSHAVPGKLKKGKKTRACDACARLKLGCDLECPCETCLYYGLECTYTRTVQQQRPGEEVAIRASSVSTCPHDDPSPVALSTATKSLGRQERSKISLAFLLNYVNPSTTALTDAFGHMKVKDDLEDPDDAITLTAAFTNDLSTSNSTQQLIFAGFVAAYNSASLDDFIATYLFPESEFHDSDSRLMSSQFEPFDTSDAEGSFDELTRLLREYTHPLSPSQHALDPNEALDEACYLFIPGNAQRFIRHYFRDYCQHAPILHPGTFDYTSITPYLLTVIVVIGALFSSDDSDIKRARGILDLVGNYVFSNPSFTNLLEEPTHVRVSTDIEEWQGLLATFFITQVQLREGSPVKRKEARDHRIGDVINGIRALGFLNTRNSFCHGEQSNSESFQWSQYADVESRIRLVCGVFHLDASFTILYNMVPRLLAEELHIDTASPVEAFFADNAQECHQASLAVRGEPSMTIAQLCRVFLEEHWTDERRSSMLNLSILRLFTIIMALLQTLWLSAYKPRKDQTMQQTSLALGRWRQIWDHQHAILTDKQRDLYGFLKTAPVEFWQIAVFLVEKKATRLDIGAEQDKSGPPELTSEKNSYACAQISLGSADNEHV